MGEDPGLDWIFSNRDRFGVLNELAGMLVQGHLSVGSEVFREYDCGLAQVTIRVDPPGDKAALEAYGGEHPKDSQPRPRRRRDAASATSPAASTSPGRHPAGGSGQAELVGWATCLATVLTHRARLPAEDVRTFATPFARLMPQLESVINSPL